MNNQREALSLMAEAIFYAQGGRLPEAIQRMQQAIRLDPQNGELYHNFGMIYSGLGQWSLALPNFTRAIELDPHPSSYEQRAQVYLQMGNRAAGRSDLEQALRLDGSRSLAAGLLGAVALEEGNHADAIRYFSRALTSEPTHAKFYLARAQAYHQSGRPTEAYADLQRARELVARGLDTSDRELTD